MGNHIVAKKPFWPDQSGAFPTPRQSPVADPPILHHVSSLPSSSPHFCRKAQRWEASTHRPRRAIDVDLDVNWVIVFLWPGGWANSQRLRAIEIPDKKIPIASIRSRLKRPNSLTPGGRYRLIKRSSFFAM